MILATGCNMTDTVKTFPKIVGLKVVRKRLTDLLFHPENPRIHPPKGTPEWNTLRESLLDDYFDPIIWNRRNGMLVGGHYRVKIFQDEGVQEVDVVEVDYDNETHLARLFAANKALGIDDQDKRRELFLRLHEIPDFKVSLTGFTTEEFNRVCLNDGVNTDELTGRDTDDEKTPRDSTKLNAVLATCVVGNITVKEGEKWVLGRHILFCGPLTTTRFEDELATQRANNEPTGMTVLFIPCPDPYMALTNREDVILVMLQPDEFVASHIVSNFAITHPDEQCQKL